MVVDLTRVAVDAFKMVLAKDDTTKTVYISGGFARNTIFTRLMATMLPDKKVYTSEIDNATALGAALAIWKNAYGADAPLTDLGLNEIKAL
jgi:sugar (pentulose or hexulose) kinase